MKKIGIQALLAVCLLLLSSGCSAGKDADQYDRFNLSDRPVVLSGRESDEGASSTEEPSESDPEDLSDPEASLDTDSESMTDPSDPSSDSESAFPPSEQDERPGTASAEPSSESAGPSDKAADKTTEAPESTDASTVIASSETEDPAPSSTGSSGVPDPYATGVVLSNGTRIYAIDAQVMTLLQDTYPVGQFVGKGIIDVSGGRDESGPLLNESEYELYPSPEYDPALYTVRSGGDFTFHRPGIYKIIADCRGLKDSFYLNFEAPEKYITRIGVCIVDDPIARNGSSGPIYWSSGSDAWGEPMGIVYNGCTYGFLQEWIGTRMNFVPEWNPDRSAILMGDTAFLVYGAIETGDVINVTSGCTFSPDFFSPAFKELLIPGDVTVTVRYGSHQCDLTFVINDRP